MKIKIYNLLQVLLLLCLTTPIASASSNITVNIIEPKQDSLVGNKLNIVVRITSQYELKSVKAKIGEKEIDLTLEDHINENLVWTGTFPLDGLQRGTHKLTVTAEDYYNNSVQSVVENAT